MSMEFKMQTDLATALPAEILFNKDELKAELAERLEYYNSLVVTEDTIKSAKDERATLNKLRTAVDTRRKEVKKQVMAPYTLFEADVKEITALIDEPIKAIDSQLQVFEDQRIEKKRSEVSAAYAELVPEELQSIIPMQMIFSPKWLNSTTSMKAVKEELATIVKRTKTDLLVLDTVEPEYAAAVREAYARTLDVEKAMAQRKALQEAAEAFSAREATKDIQETKPATQAKFEPVEAKPADPDETLHYLKLEFNLTRYQAAALRKFLDDNQIKYRKL